MSDAGPAGPLPDVVVAGFPKAGTTSLAAWLSDHPSVYVPQRKELDYFNIRWDKGHEWYRGEFRAAATHQLVVDATPRYAVHVRSHRRLADTLPDAKVILLVREPASRAVSHYWYVRDALRRELPPLDELVREELDATDDEPGTGTVAWGRYAHYIDLLATTVDPARMRVYTTDALSERPAEVFADVCSFIGVDATIQPSSVGTTLNTAFRHRSERLFQVMLRGDLHARLPWGLGARVESLNRKAVAHTPPDPITLARLRSHYAPHNEALRRWVGELPAGWET